MLKTFFSVKINATFNTNYFKVLTVNSTFFLDERFQKQVV